MGAVKITAEDAEALSVAEFAEEVAAGAELHDEVDVTLGGLHVVAGELVHGHEAEVVEPLLHLREQPILRFSQN